jgi:hypothetical protein
MTEQDDKPKASASHDPARLARACEFVGRIMYHFSRLEEQPNSAIGTLLKLDQAATEIVCANVDFCRSMSIVHSAVDEQNASLDRDWPRKSARKMFGAISEMNNERWLSHRARSALIKMGSSAQEDCSAWNAYTPRPSLVRRQIRTDVSQHG